LIALDVFVEFFNHSWNTFCNSLRDKRKLMFTLAFSFASFSFLSEIQTDWEGIQAFERFFTWSVLPLMWAVSIAVFSSLLKLERFDKPFKIFLCTLAGSIFLMIVPLPLGSLHRLLFPSVSVIVIAVSGYLYLARREISDLVFLLAMVCFTSGGLGMAFDLGVPFIAFSYTFAYVLIALVFMTSKESATGGIASFFSLRRELEKTQEKLRISQKRLVRVENIFAASPDAIAVFDLNGNIIECNQATLDFLGLSTKDEIIGKSSLTFVAKKDRKKVMKTMKSVLEKSSVTNVEYAALNKADYEFPAEFSASAIKDALGNPTGFVTIIKDITERKKMENELRNYSEHLEELVEERTRELKESQELLVKSERLAAIGQAATMVGHDLRNPLQAIENGIFYLNTEMSNLPVPQKTKKTLQAMNRSIDYADRIVKDLQSFASKREPIFRETDINAIVKDTLYYIKTPENIKTTIAVDQLPKIKADRDMLKRIFVNLAVNGIQAMKEEGGTLKVSTKKTNGSIEVTFKDTGIGIKKENLEKIFTPFFTTKAQGMGVGLAICKRFVELHGGSIKVESEESEGSTFTVNLPIQRNGGVKLD